MSKHSSSQSSHSNNLNIASCELEEAQKKILILTGNEKIEKEDLGKEDFKAVMQREFEEAEAEEERRHREAMSAKVERQRQELELVSGIYFLPCRVTSFWRVSSFSYLSKCVAAYIANYREREASRLTARTRCRIC